MKPHARQILSAGLWLCCFAVAGVGLVAYTYSITRALIAENQRQALLSELNQLISKDLYDNVLSENFIRIRDAGYFGTDEPVTIYRAYQNSQPVALLATLGTQGYGGTIRLLIAVYADGRIAGVRTLAHAETPGLGDGIEIGRSGWMLEFNDHSLLKPLAPQWHLKKEGGYFDQLTGATITSRAVVRQVRNFLLYFEENKQQLFNADKSIATSS
jgi:electron transport complex protein RnfG